MNYKTYNELVQKKFASLLSGDELYVVIEDEALLKQIKIPQFLIELSKETGEPVNNLVNYTIRYLILELKYGNMLKNKAILRVIKDYQDLPEPQRMKLIGHILKNVGELSHDK